jgi:hypothetical protein
VVRRASQVALSTEPLGSLRPLGLSPSAHFAPNVFQNVNNGTPRLQRCGVFFYINNVRLKNGSR